MSLLLLIDGQSYVLYQRIDLLLLAGWITAFKIIKDVQVLSWSQQVEQDVMLRTDTHEFSYLIHSFKKIYVVHFYLTLTLINQTSEH